MVHCLPGVAASLVFKLRQIAVVVVVESCVLIHLIIRTEKKFGSA